MFGNILFDLLILGLFAAALYAFLILPRQREFRRRQQLVRSLEVGTEVLTYGGMLGTIKQVDSERGTVILQIADGVEVRFLAAAIMDKFDAEAVAQSAQKAMK